MGPGGEEADVERLCLGLRPGASEVEEVGRARRVAVGRELRLQYRGEEIAVRRVTGPVVEVRDAVEVARGEDELVDVVVGRVGGRAGPCLTHVGDQCRANGVDAARAQDGDHALERGDALARGDVIAEVVCARVEEHVGHAAHAEDVAREALGQNLQQRARLARLGGGGRGIAADALVDHRDVLPVGRVQSARHPVEEAVVVAWGGDRPVDRRTAGTHQHARIRRRQHVHGIDEEPR